MEQAMQDLDPVETQEWLDALESVLDREGEDRAHYLMTRMGELATRSGTPLPYGITTPYRNTIPVTREAKMPGDLFMERRIRSLVRWNALAMVMRANLTYPDLGGHISTFASSATLYDIGFNYFFQAPTEEHGRSEEHTSELQSLMRISYAVFCLKQKTQQITTHKHNK